MYDAVNIEYCKNTEVYCENMGVYCKNTGVYYVSYYALYLVSHFSLFLFCVYNNCGSTCD